MKKLKDAWDVIDVQTKLNSILTLIIILLTAANLVNQYSVLNQTKKSLRILDNQYIQLNRPYLSIQNATNKELKSGLEIRTKIVNSGNTPAFVIERKLIDLYNDKPSESIDTRKYYINPHEEVNAIFAFVPNNSIKDTTPYIKEIKYYSPITDSIYTIRYWGRIINGEVIVDSIK